MTRNRAKYLLDVLFAGDGMYSCWSCPRCGDVSIIRKPCQVLDPLFNRMQVYYPDTSCGRCTLPLVPSMYAVTCQVTLITEGFSL